MRRRVRLPAVLLPWVLLAQQPEPVSTNIDLPADADIGVYYRRGTGWEEMLPEVVNWKTGGVLKHMATAGFVKGDINGHLNGVHSRNLLTSPTELVIYAPAGVAVTEYQLLHLHENSDSREFRTITGGVMHVSGGATRDVIPFEGRRLAKGVYQVLMPRLAAGEYGFLAPGAAVSANSASIGKIYTFRVDVPKGVTITGDARAQATLDPAKLAAKPVTAQPPATAATLSSGSRTSHAGGSARLPAAPESPQLTQKPMTNGDVIELKTAGLSDEFVIAKIKGSPASYNTDTDDIIALKKSNLSEPVIQAMITAASPAAGPRPLAPNPTIGGAGDAPKEGLLAKLKKAFSGPPEEHKPSTPQTESPAPAQSTLTPVTVLSKPAGARIFVDGYPAGVTPSVVKLQAGTYKLTLQADGFPAYSQQITVELGHVSSFGVALDGSK